MLERVRTMVSGMLAGQGIELVDVTYKRQGGARVLKALVDKEGGITLEECARLNGYIGAALDEGEVIGEHYILEVSSPGLDRPLKTERDFKRLIGKRVLVHTYEPIGGRRELSGVLKDVRQDGISVSEKGAEAVKIPLSKISKATFDYKGLA